MYELEKVDAEKETAKNKADDDGWSVKKKKKSSKKKQTVCRACGKQEEKKRFSKCGKCGTPYCSRECQVRDWKAVHKLNCAQYCVLRKPGGENSISHRDVLEHWMTRLRMYIGPFEIAKRRKHGHGFVYLTSSNTLEQLWLKKNVDTDGRPYKRGFEVRHLTLAEFRAMVRKNFELALVQKKLFERVNATKDDDTKGMIVVALLRDGTFVLFEAPFSPDYEICKKLSSGDDAVRCDVLKLECD